MTEEQPHFADLRDHIRDELVPRIEQLRATHQTRSRIFYVSAVISTVVVLAALGVGGYLFEITEVTTLGFAIAVAVVLIYGAGLHGVFHLLFVRGVRREYVDDVVAPLVEQLQPGVEYERDRPITDQQFESSTIAQVPVVQFECQESFRVDLDTTRVRFSEVEAIGRGRKEGESFARKRNCFALRGLFFIARLSQPVRGTTVLFPTLRRFSNAEELPRLVDSGADHEPLVRPGANWPHVQWSPDAHDEPMAPVTVPDPEFHQLFDVYSTDVASARGLLRTPVVQRLKEVHSAFGAGVQGIQEMHTGGRDYFVLTARGEQLFVGRPSVRTFDEMRRFDVAQQTQLLVQLAADVRLSLELIEALTSDPR